MDSEISIQDTSKAELPWICASEKAVPAGSIIAWSRERHIQHFAQSDIRYKTIVQGGDSVGFIIFALASDPESVELRRIVVVRPGCGIGKRALALAEVVCVEEFNRRRIWLDVFSDNLIARKLYQSCGYTRFGRSIHDDRSLILLEKWLK